MIRQSESELLTVPEVCEILRIRPSTLYEATRVGRVPCVVLWRGSRKRLLRFDRRAIEALIASAGTVTSKACRPQ